MNFYVVAVLSFSIFIAGLIGLVRIRRIDEVYYPFIFLLWLGIINELLAYFIVRQGKSNAINANLYYLLESLIIIYQFKRWNFYRAPPTIFYTLGIAVSFFWIGENFLFGRIQEFSSYFIIFHSFIIVLLSVRMINTLLARQSKKLLRNSIFVISTGFIIYFTYAALVEGFYLYGLSSGTLFRIYVSRILVFVNLFTNLLYALAVLWMPKKQRFSF